MCSSSAGVDRMIVAKGSLAKGSLPAIATTQIRRPSFCREKSRPFKRSPGPPFRPDSRQTGERGAIHILNKTRNVHFVIRIATASSNFTFCLVIFHSPRSPCLFSFLHTHPTHNPVAQFQPELFSVVPVR